LILIVCEVAANYRRCADDAEERGRCGRAANAFGSVSPADRHAARRPGTEVDERVLFSPPIQVATVRRGTVGETRQLASPELDQLARIWKWEWRQNHCVDDGEERCGGADAQGERENGGERKSRLANERAKGVAEVVKQLQHGQLDVAPTQKVDESGDLVKS
jgi:hypothetical protein